VSDRSRKTTITAVDSTAHHPTAGTITTDGSTTVSTSSATIYSHVITKTITEDLSCRTHHAPVSGEIQTVYNGTTIVIDLGDGTCTDNTISITVNGVTTTQTLGD
jgi:hypothetical protein